MGLKGYLYRKVKEKIDQRNTQNQFEKSIREQVKRENYGPMYSKEYKKQLGKEIRTKIQQQKSGGGFLSGLKEARRRGLFNPDQAGIDRALHGTFPGLVPTPIGRAKLTKKQKVFDVADIL